MTATIPKRNHAPSQKEEGPLNQRKLWQRYCKCEPGSAAENSLVEQYLPLVKTVVGRLAMTLPSHINIDDLYSAGLVGLLDAVRRFDPAAGSSFEAYARVRIRGTIFDELRQLDWVPRSVHDKARKVEQTMRALMQRNGGIPSSKDMARALDLSPREYEQLSEEIRPTTYVCLDWASCGERENQRATHESVADESQADPGECASLHEMARIVQECLEQLPELQRKVLALYYFQDLRLREIAEAFGVSESRICQLHGQAISTIKAFLHRQDPDVFNDSLRIHS